MTLHAKDFPLILAGPILRRVTFHSVSVFLALKEKRWVQLKLYAHPNMFQNGSFSDDPIDGIVYPLQPTVQLGKHLHVALVTVEILSPNQGLQPGQLYGYNTFFHLTDTDNGDSTSLAETSFNLLSPDNQERLGYNDQWLPSFSLPPSDISALKIIHGSCRKPHGEGKDMLSKLDDYFAHNNLFQDPNNRPHLLLLTGDQIYADDVNPILLRLLHDASRALLGWEETFPETGQPEVVQRLEELASNMDALNTQIDEINADLSQILENALNKVIEIINTLKAKDPSEGSQLTRQLIVFAAKFIELMTSDANLTTNVIGDQAEKLKKWCNKHKEIFDNLSSHHHWGQPAIIETEANEGHLNDFKIAIEGIPSLNDTDAADVISYFAYNLDPEKYTEIEGYYFNHRLSQFHEQATVLSNADPIEVMAVEDFVDALKAWVKDEDVFDYIPSRISPPQRAKELKQFSGITTDPEVMLAHLMFLGEFYMMYLFTWSDAVWLQDDSSKLRLPEFFESVPNYGIRGKLNKRNLEKSRKDLEAFANDVGKVRRVLANIPTLMMFDDHEVTDDWNINLDWVAKMNSSVMGPQILRNALAAYAVFQDWGNQPEDYQNNNAGRTILDALTMPNGGNGEPLPPPIVSQDEQKDEIDLLFGIGSVIAEQLNGSSESNLVTTYTLKNGADEPIYIMVKPAGRKIWDWEHVPNTAYKIISLDTRTHRAFPTEYWARNLNVPISALWQGNGVETGGRVAAANLIQPDELERQLVDRLKESTVNFVISPAPVFGLPILEDFFQRLKALGSGPEVADFEAWAGNPDGFKSLLSVMTGKNIVLLSGDVHYAYTNILSFPVSDTTPPPIMQLCSSSMKNETDGTRALGVAGRKGRFVEFLELKGDLVDFGWNVIVAKINELWEDWESLRFSDIPIWFFETAPVLSFWKPDAYISYFLALKGMTLLSKDIITWGYLGIGSDAARYFFLEILAGFLEIFPGGNEGIYERDGHLLRFIADIRDNALRQERAGELNDTLPSDPELGAKLRQQAEVVGFNNFGKISFLPDASNSKPFYERISHELFWLTHDNNGKPENILASTIHDYVPTVMSFRQEIVRVAKKEYEQWNPKKLGISTTINASGPDGLAILARYYGLWKSENTELSAVFTNGEHIQFDGPHKEDEDGLYWSATFISYVIKAAQARQHFFYSPRHIDYIRRAKANNSSNDHPFVLRSIEGSEPEPGDLLVQWKGEPFTFDEILTEDAVEDRACNVYVVVAISDDNDDDNEYAYTVGVNTSPRVTRQSFNLENGKLSTNDNFVAMIKIERAP